jgi:hypothetical protein
MHPRSHFERELVHRELTAMSPETESRVRLLIEAVR